MRQQLDQAQQAQPEPGRPVTRAEQIQGPAPGGRPTGTSVRTAETWSRRRRPLADAYKVTGAEPLPEDRSASILRAKGNVATWRAMVGSSRRQTLVDPDQRCRGAIAPTLDSPSGIWRSSSARRAAAVPRLPTGCVLQAFDILHRHGRGLGDVSGGSLAKSIGVDTRACDRPACWSPTEYTRPAPLAQMDRESRRIESAASSIGAAEFQGEVVTGWCG